MNGADLGVKWGQGIPKAPDLGIMIPH